VPAGVQGVEHGQKLRVLYERKGSSRVAEGHRHRRIYSLRAGRIAMIRRGFGERQHALLLRRVQFLSPPLLLFYSLSFLFYLEMFEFVVGLQVVFQGGRERTVDYEIYDE